MLMDFMTREIISHLNTKKTRGKETKVFRITQSILKRKTGFRHRECNDGRK
jgi:hypothetical protein